MALLVEDGIDPRGGFVVVGTGGQRPGPPDDPVTIHRVEASVASGFTDGDDDEIFPLEIDDLGGAVPIHYLELRFTRRHDLLAP